MYSRRVAINLVILGLMASMTEACAQVQTSSRESSLETVFADLASLTKSEVDTGAVAGIAIGLSNGKSRYNQAYGYADLNSKSPMTTMTPLRIASITKPITATAILRLHEKGLLKLDQTIDRFFPEFPKGDRITIYHLLTHTSGLSLIHI